MNIKEKTMNDVIIEPSRRSPRKSASLWEVRDNRNKLVGTFDPNKDKTRDKFDKLRSVAQVRNIAHDLFDVRQRIKDLIHKDNAWEISQRALQACSQTKDAIAELDEIIDYIKQS